MICCELRDGSLGASTVGKKSDRLAGGLACFSTLEAQVLSARPFLSPGISPRGGGGGGWEPSFKPPNVPAFLSFPCADPPVGVLIAPWLGPSEGRALRRSRRITSSFLFFFSLVKLVKTKSVYCDTRASLDDCRVNARRCRLVMYENIFSVLWNEQTAAHQKLCFLSETVQRSWNHTRQLWPSHVQRLQNEQSHK